jgi:hypothetical protein
MALSFDPDWQYGWAYPASAMSVDPPSGGAVQVAAAMVTDNAVLDDTGGFTLAGSVSELDSGDEVNTYVLWREASSDPITFTFTVAPGTSPDGVVTCGAFPAGVTVLLPPAEWTALPDDPFGYSNPQELNNIGATEIPAYVPAGTSAVAGVLLSAAGLVTPEPLTLLGADGEWEQSDRALAWGDNTRNQLRCFALEPSADPAQILVNEALSSERRWSLVLGRLTQGRWRVGSIGFIPD